MLGRLPAEVQVVHRPDDAPHGIQQHVKVDHRERDPFSDHAQQHEQVGDHHRGEQLQEVLHPEVDDPEPPEVSGGEGVIRAGQQADGVHHRDGQTREQEQRLIWRRRWWNGRRQARGSAAKQAAVVAKERPTRRLSEAATNTRLLVAGSRGRSGTPGMLLGSTSQSLLSVAPCLVAIVRH
ncbi:MAG: universal stress protein [Pseudonocardiales bacterium]|nr:universal stress protein [Pseudonocardiales bacterium]MBV9729726.1 universal stress protein [Pseudonocardiales bacterium]